MNNTKRLRNVVLAASVAMGMGTLSGCVVEATDDNDGKSDGTGGGQTSGEGGASAGGSANGGSASGGNTNAGAGGAGGAGGEEPMGPDLVVDGWGVSYYVPSAGDTNVTICLNRKKNGEANPLGQNLKVTNVGTEEATSYEVALGIRSEASQQAYYCPDHLQKETAHSPGSTATWEGPFCCEVSTVNVPDGTYRLAVLADVGEDVEELDETNNLSVSNGTLEVVTIFGSCQGTPLSCSQRVSSCNLGCHLGHDCNGYASSCSSYFGYASCEQQDGCNYNGLYPNGYCSGSADSCSSMSSEYSCDSQDGCHWDEACEGTPQACPTFGTPSECGQQPGCSWQ